MTEQISKEPISDEDMQEMIEADSRLPREEERLTAPQLHRRRLLALVARLREQNHQLLNGGGA